ncbi:isochorismatase family cysteine hydrolase [Chitinophaga vietnamensis]|uniref:isochorismatase family cysteine hydrolase n=1 Tax=Chitinophaga vietnamensis TaxID=2593957 RepID=UPI0011783662|nr:isochorismatase family cysteine hydrolase [Chitinophaga vietnamensis]
MITTIDSTSALVLIDLQAPILGLPALHPIEGILDRAAALVAAFRRKQRPVVFVSVNSAGAPWVQARTQEPRQPLPPQMIQMMQDGSFVKIAPQLDPRPDDIYVTKQAWSAFYKTPLEEILSAKGITQIVLGGVATSMGVEGTARDAHMRAFHVSFATDAITDRSAQAHESSMQVIFPKLGELGTAADIIAKL